MSSSYGMISELEEVDACPHDGGFKADRMREIRKAV